jgi:hypothetical protein
MACRWAIMALFLRGAQSAPCSNDFWSDSSIKTLRTVAQELYVAPGSRSRARARLLSFSLSQWLRCHDVCTDNPTLYRIMVKSLARPVETAVCLLEQSVQSDAASNAPSQPSDHVGLWRGGTVGCLGARQASAQQLATLIPAIDSDLSFAVLKGVWAVLSAAAEEVSWHRSQFPRILIGKPTGVFGQRWGLQCSVCTRSCAARTANGKKGG